MDSAVVFTLYAMYYTAYSHFRQDIFYGSFLLMVCGFECVFDIFYFVQLFADKCNLGGIIVNAFLTVWADA